MNVLSLFDGMSCGRIALREAGIPVDNYFACEIDRHAVVQVGMLRHAAVQDARQRLDGRGHKAHIVVPARNGKDSGSGKEKGDLRADGQGAGMGGRRGAVIYWHFNIFQNLFAVIA